MDGLWGLLGAAAGALSVALRPDVWLLLAATAGFTAVRVANHRSRRTGFRLSLRDPFQWAELGFFAVLLVRGLLG